MLISIHHDHVHSSRRYYHYRSQYCNRSSLTDIIMTTIIIVAIHHLCTIDHYLRHIYLRNYM